MIDKNKYVLIKNYNVYGYKSFINYYDFHYLNTNLYYIYLNGSNKLNSVKENNLYLMTTSKFLSEVETKLTNYNFIYLNNVGEVNIFELNKK